MSGNSEIHANIEDEIKQSGNLIVVEVLLNGVLRPFIVDSGSSTCFKFCIRRRTKYKSGSNFNFKFKRY